MPNDGAQIGQMEQITQMEQQLLGNARNQVSQHAEMAKLAEMEFPFQADAEIQSKFPSVEVSQADNPGLLEIALELEQKMSWGPWSYQDPMSSSFEFRMCYELGKLAGKTKEEIGMVRAKFWQMLAAFLLIVGVAGQLGGWSSYEMVQLTVQLVMSYQLLPMSFQVAQMEVLVGKMTSAVEHLRFVSSAAGGNRVKQMMCLFDKVSYIELRLMHMTGSGRGCRRQLSQILYDELSEKLTVIKALGSQSKSWLAARMRFKYISQFEWDRQFMQNWGSAADGALAKWQERAEKLFDSFELKMYEEPCPED
jgi:hypothetical protein